MKKNYFLILVPAILSVCFTGCVTGKKNKSVAVSSIQPGAVWPDDKGNHVQAHGGGIIKIKNVYYWYGEERRQGLDSNTRYVSCYTSNDLTNWKFEGDVLKLTDP